MNNRRPIRLPIRLMACFAALAISLPALAQSQGAKTLALLTKPLTVKVEDAPFEDLVEFVRTATGATVDVAWITSRHSDGLDPEALVSVDVQGAQALALLLHAARQASHDDFQDPTWQLDHQTGALQIGPRSRLNKFKRLEMYDINDLILVLPDYTDVPRLNLNSVVRQGQGGSSGGIFQQTQNQTTDTDPRAEAERIMEILRAVIETDEWIDNGGDGATVRFYEGNLLVSAPDYIHRQINGYTFLAGPVGRPALSKAAPANDTEQAKADAEDAKDNEAAAESSPQ